jgi:antitoxin component YwqK of YwqJK toxin-antitoxin module
MGNYCFYPLLLIYFLLSACAAGPILDEAGRYFLKEEPFSGKHKLYYGPKMVREELLIQNGNVLVRMCYDTGGVHNETYIYYVGGMLQEHHQLDSEGNLRVKKIYSPAGHLQEKIQYRANGDLLWRELYSYDGQGNVIETSIYDSSGKITGRMQRSPDGSQIQTETAKKEFQNE